MVSWIFVFAIASYFVSCSAVSLLFTDATVKECFIIEEPQDTLVTVHYEIKKSDAQTRFNGDISVTHRGSYELLKGKSLPSMEDTDKITDTLEFTTNMDGSYDICFNKVVAEGEDGTQPDAVVKDILSAEPIASIDLTVAIGHSDAYYEDLALKYHMGSLKINAERLSDQLAQTLAEADYMKEREVEFHTQSENMNSAALWWPILQVMILLITGVFQVVHLKHFFKAKRLV